MVTSTGYETQTPKMPSALDYAQDLVRFNSVSSLSNVEVTDYVESVLKQLGFEVERLEYDDENRVRKANVVGKRGAGTGGMAYFGHTDVVPADDWKFAEHGPFTPTVRDGKLWGRGACDMKGSIASMLAALERTPHRELSRPVYFTCTADEEVGMTGASFVAEHSRFFKEMVASQAYAVIGEPTRLQVVHGHKGGRAIRVTSRGRAAHSSTGKGINANWAMIPFLNVVKEIKDEMESDARWQHPEFDPPTMTPNVGINDFTRAINITAPQSVCNLYFRPMPGMDVKPIMDRLIEAAEENGLEWEIRLESDPLYVPPGSPFVKECLKLAGCRSSHTVAYGTDGARFGALENRIVIGPGDIAQAHTHDEWIDLRQLELGADLYARMIAAWCR